MGAFYAAIWRTTWRQQLLLIALSVSVAALAAAPLKFQQEVINNLVAGGDLDLLIWLCAGYFGVVLLSAALKFAHGYKISMLGEQVTHMIRARLYTNYVEDTGAGVPELPRRGTMVTMISAEAEGVGHFAGAAIAEPLVQIGMLVAVIGFIFVNQPGLGIIAMGVVLPQAVIVFVIQRFINIRVRQRVQALRDVSDRISDSDLADIEAEIIRDFDTVLEVRRQLFAIKLSSKFALNAINAAGTAGILLLGGWLVIDGQSDVGMVVAALSGLVRIAAPWRELLTFFRTASMMRVKYEMLVQAVAPRAR